MNATHSTLIVVLLAATMGCGDDGPSGPQGNAGIYSETFVFSMLDAQVNGSVASVQFEVPSITPRVVDFGAVLVFFREQGTWTAMPYTFAEESPDLPAVDYTISLGYGFDDHLLEVFYEASTTEVDLFAQPDREMRMIVLDDLAVGKTGIDLTDYHAVRAYYRLGE
ncbi:MAG: hypothetical protein WD021_01815 [Rhodothermales bacterium]